MNIFVPGRICLFGEHSDWAGGYRRINAEIEKGVTLIAGTNHGLYASVKPHPSMLVIRSLMEDGVTECAVELPMEQGALIEEAEKGGFFSYAAGVAYQVMTHYRVRGLEIDNYRTDLPIKKGLSSSAAVCVLVARAFNRTYDLKMTVRGEMEFAYLGEITTPSRCGRMDQGCAYGNRPVMMVFDGERLDVDELNVKSEFHLVIVDLAAGKDTKEILNRLNHCYPFADNEVQRNVQNYLGKVSAGIAAEARDALTSGNAEQLGQLMTRAQKEFDRLVQPACPSQLTAPVLHKVLSHKPLQKYVFGGKGVGSQGDGSAQFVAKDAEAQAKAIELIENDLGMQCLSMVLRPRTRVRKAVIPAAGFGTRLFPATKAIKKELFPIVDREGRIKPVILAIAEEALNSGIEEVCVVVQKEDRELFEPFFNSPPPIENFNKLSKENKDYNGYLMDVGQRITFVSQDVQEGFGHAVYCARDWVDDEPFILMLGDHLYASLGDKSCVAQVLDAFTKLGQSVVGLKSTAAAEVHNFGCVAGEWVEEDVLLSLTEFREKPDAEYAAKHLRIERMKENTYLSVFGIYALKPRVFEYIEEHIQHNIREQGEFQLTSCLDRLRKEDGFGGVVIRGSRFDIGLPDAYRQTLIDYRTA